MDMVVNFDIPSHSKDYIHRVGRTARAGRSGKSLTFVTQYDVELFQRIEVSPFFLILLSDFIHVDWFRRIEVGPFCFPFSF